MSEAIFSPSWYRVADLKPTLRAHARMHRHVYRGETWYVLQDFSSGRFHRFRPAAQRVIGLMDGRRSVAELWHLVCDELGDDAPTQGEMIRLLAQLHQADLLQTDVTPDTLELLERREKQTSRKALGRLMNPFSVQIPLFDPDRWLMRHEAVARWAFSRRGALVWLAVVVPALALGATHFDELSEGVLDRLLTPQNLMVMWLVFPLVKGLHELGHAFAARVLGGEVHEMGVMLLVFTPVPYVDASSSSAFARSRDRMLVGAAGMIVEVFLAAVAMLIWVAVEPGVIRALAFNTILIASFTTVAFNANPLLRFDGYYVLADWLQIPNLRQRSNQYVGYLLERWVLLRRDAHPPSDGRRERAWLIGFAVASFVYRMVVLFAIALLVLDFSIVLGTLLLGVSAVSWVGMPLWRGVRFLGSSPRLERVRGRALWAAAAGAALIFLAVAVVPLPLRTQAEGVIWLPDEAVVRATASGFIERVVAEPDSVVEAGALLLSCRDPALAADILYNEARVRELEARYEKARDSSPAEARLVLEELGYARESLARARERAQELDIRAATAGRFVLSRAGDLPGRFVDRGQQLGHVVDLDAIRVRAVVPQDDVGLVRNRLEGVDVRLSERVDRVLPATLVRFVPAASDRLPSSALGSEGGGSIAIDPRDPDGASAVQSLFQLELLLPEDSDVANVGGRVHLRFDHGRETLASQLWRRLRQLFLSRLDV